MCKGTVLIVEDDRAIQAFVTAALEMEGYRVYQAVDGEALHLARAVHPDVILLDVMMPEMNGAQVSQRLRAEAATAGIPIVAMTTLSRSDAPADMRADDWIEKPFHLAALYHVVARWASVR